MRGKGREGVNISHLLFTDDTLVFCEACEKHMTYLSRLLMWFEALSGLKINLDKSELISTRKVNNIENLAFELGCKMGGLPSSYLGLRWVPHLSLLGFGMVWKRGLEKDWSCGRDTTSLNERELHLFKAACLVCPFILCPYYYFFINKYKIVLQRGTKIVTHRIT